MEEQMLKKTLQGFPSEAVNDAAVWRLHKDACCSLAGFLSLFVAWWRNTR